MFCVICKDDKPESVFSDEHVVPEFMGGALIIKSVCASCNSKMGGDFEGRLSNNFLFKTPRHIHGIAGKSEKPPHPFEGIHEMEGGRTVRVNGDGKMYMLPKNIEMKALGDKFSFNFSLDASDKEKVPEILKKKIIRHMKSAGEPINEAEIDQRIASAMCNAGVQENIVNNPVISFTESFNFDDIKLLMIKIAHETACHHYGARYVSDQRAELLRKSLFKLQVAPELGNIWPVQDDELFSGMLPQGFHWVLLVGAACYIRLYDHWVGILQYATELDNFRNMFVAYRYCYKTQTVQQMDSSELFLSLRAPSD